MSSILMRVPLASGNADHVSSGRSPFMAIGPSSCRMCFWLFLKGAVASILALYNMSVSF